MGIHTGPVELADDRYVGLAVHRAARICAAGHGGQVLVSHTSVALLEDEAHALSEIEFRDLGEQELKDFHRPCGCTRSLRRASASRFRRFGPLRRLLSIAYPPFAPPMPTETPATLTSTCGRPNSSTG
jgi:class 3 adenylate cyclase